MTNEQKIIIMVCAVLLVLAAILWAAYRDARVNAAREYWQQIASRYGIVAANASTRTVFGQRMVERIWEMESAK